MVSSILVVDDDAAFRRLLRAVFASRGWRLYEARRISEARAELAARQIDLVIVDGLLPDGNGLDLLAEIAQSESKTRRIFVSAFRGFHDKLTHRRLVDDLRVSLVLRKPLIATELVAQIESLLQSDGGRGETGARNNQPEWAGESALATELEDLRLAYVQKLRDQLGALRKEVREAAASKERRKAAASNVRFLAHKLHGTSGTCGYPEVSANLGRIESLMAESEVEPELRTERFYETIEAVLAEAEEKLAAPTLRDGQVESGDQDRRLANGTALIVHADPQLLGQIARIGEKHLFAVRAFADEAQALAGTRNQQIDAALISTSLPDGGNPYRLAASIRSRIGCNRMGVAFIADTDDLRTRLLAVEAEADLFLVQSSDPEQYAQVIDRLMIKSRQARPKALIVEDDADFAGFLSQELTGSGIDSVHLNEPTEIFATLERERPDIVISDIIMPGISGFDLCRIVRSQLEWSEIPIVLITAGTDSTFRKAAYDAGADDYVLKPIVKEELLGRIRARLERARVCGEHRRHDSLTGLALRSTFQPVILARMADAVRRRSEIAFALLDVDHFKRVNDAYGHFCGDRVLATLGKLLKMRLRTEDAACRWGGEEIVIAYGDTPAEAAKRSLDRILDEFRSFPFQSEEGETFRASFSAGIAAFPAEGKGLSAVLEVADRRLYHAKRAGRSRILVSSSEIEENG
ncbi:MAG: response regulator [Candidatus Schekmanbacteria bacterium]|nr:response regulator [Candidatus Schekmanbacteria bacterium]